MTVQLVKVPINDGIPKKDLWYMPLELMQLSHSLKESGIDSEILDGTVISLDEILISITSEGIVGLNFSHLAGQNVEPIIEVARTKQNIVVAGGVAVTAVPEEVAKHVDYVIVGDGETSLPLLAKGVAIDSIPNLVYYKGGQLRKTPVVQPSTDRFDGTIARTLGGLQPTDYLGAYADSNTLINIDGERPTNIMTQRGCPRTCGFCARTDKSLWSRTPESALLELEELTSKYGIDHVVDTSDTSAITKQRLKDFATLRSNSDYDLPTISVFADLRDITPETLQVMRDCGITHVVYGVESGSTRGLKSIGKNYGSNGTDSEVILERIRMSSDHGMKVSASFIVGLPNETRERLDETMDLVRELSAIPGVISYGNIMIPLPGSRVFRDLCSTVPEAASSRDPLMYNLENVRELYIENCTSVSLDHLEQARRAINGLGGIDATTEYAR